MSNTAIAGNRPVNTTEKTERNTATQNKPVNNQLTNQTLKSPAPMARDNVRVENKQNNNSAPVCFVENNKAPAANAHSRTLGATQRTGIIGRALSGTPSNEEYGYRRTGVFRNVGRGVTPKFEHLNRLTRRPEVTLKFLENQTSTAEERRLYSPNRGNVKGLNENWSPTKGNAYFYMNGIFTEECKAQTTGATLSRLLGNNVKVETIHNPTDGLVDGKNAVTERVAAPGMGRKASPIETQYAQRIYEALNNGQRPKLIAHSEGTIITANALQMVKDRLIAEHKPVIDMMKNIDVAILGPFANVADFPKDVNIVEMRDQRDFVARTSSPMRSLPLAIANPSLLSNRVITSSTYKPFEAYRQAQHSGASQATLNSIANDAAVGKTVNGVTGAIVNGIVRAADMVNGVGFVQYHSVDENYLTQPNVANFFQQFGNKNISDIRNQNR